MDSFASKQEPVSGSCEHRNEPSDETKFLEFLDKLKDY
jgi:hypothetical protein